MSILVVEGEQVSGAVDNAAYISCLDKDGNKSNVQAELDKKGSGGGAEVRKMTQAAYDALPEEEQNSGMYLIEDGGELTAKNMAYDDTETQLGVNNVQDAIVEQSKNFQWWIDNGFLPDPNTNKLLIMAKGIFFNGQSISVGTNTFYDTSFSDVTNALQIRHQKTRSDNINAGGFAVLNDALDLTNYQKLCVLYDVTSIYTTTAVIAGGEMGDQFSLRRSKTDFKFTGINGNSNVIKPTQINMGICSMCTAEIDVSDLDGLYYFGISQGNWYDGQCYLTICIRDIWLE